jgi:signal transduction histidine kinase
LPQMFMQEFASIYQVRFQEKHIILDLDISNDLPKVSIDPGRMTQVFMNVIDNAFRYTPDNGRIILSAHQLDDQVELGVQDNGSGVPVADLDRIFDRLYRVDSSRQHEDGGSGLGLAIARSIVEMHQGRIKASRPVGGGLKISILLPTNIV